MFNLYIYSLVHGYSLFFFVLFLFLFFYIQNTAPNNKNTNVTATSIIQSLKDEDFFDRGTRAVAVELTFYNTNTELMTSVRYIIEQFPSGLVESSARYRTARLSVLSSKWVRTSVFLLNDLFLTVSTNLKNIYIYNSQSYINLFMVHFFFFFFYKLFFYKFFFSINIG